MARRWHLSPGGGLRISKPGFDAATTADTNLLFSTTTPQLQVITSGSAVAANDGNSIYYPIGLAKRPVIFCGILDTASMLPLGGGNWDHAPFKATDIVSSGTYVGFTAYALPSLWSGIRRGVGQTFKFVVFGAVA